MGDLGNNGGNTGGGGPRSTSGNVSTPTTSGGSSGGGARKALGKTVDVAGEVIKTLGLAAASAAIPGFGQSYVQSSQQAQQQYDAQSAQLLTDLRQAPRFALNPAIQREIKQRFGEDSLGQFIAEANRVSIAEQFIQGMMQGYNDTADQMEAAGMPQAPTSAQVGGLTGAPGAIGGGATMAGSEGVSAAPASVGATPVSAPAPAPAAQPAAAPRRGPRTPATALQERLAPGQSVTVKSGGVSATVRGLTAAEQAEQADEFEGILRDVVAANPHLTPEQAIRKASQEAVGRARFASLPDEAKTLLTTGKIEEIRQEVQAMFERKRAFEQTVGQRGGRLEQPISEDEAVNAKVQAEIDRFNALLQQRGLPPLSEQEVADQRLARGAELQNELLRERTRTTVGATLPTEPDEQGVVPLPPKDLQFYSDLGDTLDGWSSALELLEATAEKFGPIEGRGRSVLEVFGLESPEFTQTRVALARLVEDTIRMLQGAKASDRDREKIEKLFPSPTDSMPVIVGQTAAALEEAIRKLHNRTRVLKQRGHRVPETAIPPSVQQFLEKHRPAVTLEDARKAIKRGK